MKKKLLVCLVTGLLLLTSIGMAYASNLNKTEVSQLYVSIFGRASEGEGNSYWCANYDDMVLVAETMLNTDAAKTYFGDTLNNNQKLIEFIYENTLGKTYSEDPDGVDYWVGELTHGNSKGVVITSLISAVMDSQYLGSTAQTRFQNKVAICNYTADTITSVPDLNDLSAFVAFISDVTDESITVSSTKDDVDTFAKKGKEPPEAPTGVSGKGYSDKIILTWNSSSGATSYEIWRNTSNSTSSASKVGTATSTSYSDYAVAADKSYYYWVKAVNSTGTSGFFNGNKISAPTDVSATDETYTDKVEITWNSSSGATSYEVWRNTSDSTSSASKIGTATNIDYSDYTAAAGKTYYYWVKAVNSTETSGFSSSDSGNRKSATESLASISQLVGMWSIQDAVSFEVLKDGSIVNFTATLPMIDTYRTNDKSSLFATFNNVVIDPNNFSFKASFSKKTKVGSVYSIHQDASIDGTFLSPDSAKCTWNASKTLVANYAFKGNGDFTIVKVSSTPPVPSAPSDVSATDGAYNDKVRITWNPSSVATSYEVWRNTSNSTSSASKIGTATSTWYIDSIETAGKIYYYWVKAVNSIGNNSGFSSIDPGHSAIPLSAPTGVSATNGTNILGITITWNSSAGATSYEIWRNTSNSISSASKLASRSSTSYNDYIVTRGKIYYYWVKAVNSIGSSDFSDVGFGYQKKLW